MLSPPLLPLSPVWSHAAMGGARGCGVAVPSLSLNESLSKEAEVSSELHAIIVKIVRHLSITPTKTLKNIVKIKMQNFWLQLSHEVRIEL